MSDSNMFDLFCFNGEPLRRHKTKTEFERYRGRGTWELYGSSEYVARRVIPMSAEDHAGLIEAHDLALPDEEFDEDKWRVEVEAQEAEVKRAIDSYELSRGEATRAEYIAFRLYEMARREVTTKDRMRPRAAVAGTQAGLALVEHWFRSPVAAAFDRFLPPYEVEDTRARLHICRGLAPGARSIGRSPEGAAVMLLSQGTAEVRRFLHLPYMQAVNEFRQRWTIIPRDSEEATILYHRDRERARAAADTWNALSMVEEEFLLGLFKALKVDHERFEQVVKRHSAW